MSTQAERTDESRQGEKELQSSFSPMRIWDKVFETNPAHTKHVSLGARKFTSIDPYQQIRRVTELFGPVGQGWGWAVKEISYPPEGFMVVVHITFWWREPHPDPLDAGFDSTIHTFDELEACAYRSPKNDRSTRCQEMDQNGQLVWRYDEDCVKKATTGAITKALSRLGFNADVFLGGFDDNRYIAKMERKFAEEKESKRHGQQTDEAPQRTVETAGGGGRPPRQAVPPDGPEPGPSGDPQPPMNEATGKPDFYVALIGGTGQNSDRNWGWMADGSPSGRRKVWLDWALTHYKDPKTLNRVRWILENEY
jgi:hypothetical protein